MIWSKSLIFAIYFVVTTASFELDCELSRFEKTFDQYRLKKQTKKCILKSNNQEDINEDEDISNVAIVFTDDSVGLLPGTDKIFSKIKQCIFLEISSNIERDWFKNLLNLEELYFMKNNISKLYNEIFIDLGGNLQILNLRSNQITEVEEKTFAGLKKLTQLNLGFNKIKVLHPNLFKDLVSLKELYLHENPIKTLDKQHFMNLGNLEKLNLKRNSVDSIPAGVFVNNKKIEKLFFSGPVTKIDENSFDGLENLYYLDFSGHDLEFLPPKLFKNLTSLIEFKSMDCRNWKYLNVSLFQSLVNLEHLNLAFNQIEEVPDGLLEKNSKLKIISLNGKISRMSNKIFSNLKHLNYINLKDNYCISEIFHDFHQSFIEDILISCSCELPKKNNSALRLKKFLIYSGLLGAIILVIFATFLNYKQKIKNKLQEKSAFKNVVTRVLNEYISNTSIHGLNYATDERSFLISRIFWVAILLVSIIALTYYSFNTYIRRQERPVILGFDEQLTDMFEIPFPAITICPNFKFNKEITDLDQIIKTYKTFKADSETTEKLEVASMFCDGNLLKRIDLSHLSETFDIRKFLEKERLLGYLFYWRNAASYYASSTLTEEGICMTFNSINTDFIFRNDTVDPIFLEQYGEYSDDPVFWDIEHGYTPNKVNNYPLRIFDTGQDNALKVEIGVPENKSQHIDTICRGNSMNVKIAFHHPAEVVGKMKFTVPFNTSASFFVKPKITKTAESLKSHDALVRQCYFHGERQLKFFKIYTSANCELECLANLTLRYCNCSAFFMPRTKDTPICRSNQHKKCLKYAQHSLSNMFQINLNCDPTSANDGFSCRCFPPCNEITYDAEQISHAYHADELKYFSRTLHLPVVEFFVYFNGRQFTSMMRSELYGFIDFISNCGGLMGLFMGISLLSIVEIIYYCLYLVYQLISKTQNTSNRVYDLN